MQTGTKAIDHDARRRKRRFVPVVLVGAGLLSGCIAPPPKSADDDGTSASNGSGKAPEVSEADLEKQIADLELMPVIPDAAIIWDGNNESFGGNNIALINIDPGGSWFAFNDGSPGGEMKPPSTDEFLSAMEDGAIHSTGMGFKEWGGGLGMNFVGSPMLTPVDLTKYKGITFKAKGKGWVHVGLATVITLPEFEICSTCYDHYAVDIKLTDEMKTYEYTWKQLRQAGWGAPTDKTLDPATVVGLNFTSRGPSAWDFTIDDVGFLE